MLTPKRRPVPISQTPTRQTQKLAADTFSPVRVRTATSSTIGSRAGVVSPPDFATPLPSSSTAQRKLGPITRQQPSSVSRKNKATVVLSQDIIDQLLPYLLERIKGGERSEMAELAARDRSASPTLSNSSGGSTVRSHLGTGERSDNMTENEDQPDGPQEHDSPVDGLSDVRMAGSDQEETNPGDIVEGAKHPDHVEDDHFMIVQGGEVDEEASYEVIDELPQSPGFDSAGAFYRCQKYFIVSHCI